MNDLKISLLDAGEVERNLVKEFQAGGVQFIRTEDGGFAFVVKPPGQKEIALTINDLDAIADTLTRPVPENTSSSPGEIFATSARYEDGKMIARFSNEPRARNLEVPLGQAQGLADFFIMLKGKAEYAREQYEIAEKKAAKDKAAKK